VTEYYIKEKSPEKASEAATLTRYPPAAENPKEGGKTLADHALSSRKTTTNKGDVFWEVTGKGIQEDKYVLKRGPGRFSWTTW